MPPSPGEELRGQLGGLTLRDERRLRRQLDDAGTSGTALEKVQQEVDAAQRRVTRRRASVPPIRYPADLPISERKDEILDAVGWHQVVIVAGETGSGKSTQLAKMCLELGRGIRGTIGHTQPRRIAAR